MKKNLNQKSDLLFNIFNYSFLITILILILYPLYFIVIASISDPAFVNTGKVVLLPKGITFEGYKNVFSYNPIWVGYRNTVFYTLAGTIINITLTIMFAYPLSRSVFSGKRFLTVFLLITMYFNGGLIPTYILVKQIGLYNSVWAILLVNAITGFNVIITRTYLKDNVPEGIYESAIMDGCNHFTFLWKMVLPLSKAIIAVLALYYGIAHWNDFFNALIYLKDADKMPLQIILRSILIQNQAALDTSSIDDQVKKQQALELMKYGLIIVSSLPVLIVYPFLQKYFVQGMTIGSVKG